MDKTCEKGKECAQITGANTLSPPFDIHSMYIIHRSKLMDKSINSTSKPETTGESNPPLLPNHDK